MRLPASRAFYSCPLLIRRQERTNIVTFKFDWLVDARVSRDNHFKNHG